MNTSIAEEKEKGRDDGDGVDGYVHGFADGMLKSGQWVGNHNLGANGEWATIRRTGGKGYCTIVRGKK